MAIGKELRAGAWKTVGTCEEKTLYRDPAEACRNQNVVTFFVSCGYEPSIPNSPASTSKLEIKSSNQVLDIVASHGNNPFGDSLF